MILRYRTNCFPIDPTGRAKTSNPTQGNFGAAQVRKTVGISNDGESRQPTSVSKAFNEKAKIEEWEKSSTEGRRTPGNKR